jgi:hypothetical protein
MGAQHATPRALLTPLTKGNIMSNKWELYEDHPLYATATAALDAAWQQAIRLSPEKPSRDRALAAMLHVHKVMETYSAVGANDSEPRWHLEHLIETHFGELMS